MRPLTVALLAALGVTAAGCIGSEPESRERPEQATSGELTVTDGRLTRSTWAAGTRLHRPGEGEPERLSGPVQASFVGTLSPAAVPSPAGDGAIAYSSFRRRRPVVRVHEAGGRSDRVLDEGAYSPVWADSGLAYFRGLTARVTDPARHLGHVVVRATPDAPAERWTARPGRYAPSAWAGERLLVHELTRRTWPTLVAYDGPRRRRVLARRTGLVAVSPDGTRAFVAKEPRGAPVVALIDLARGREVARLRISGRVSPARRQRITSVSDSGAWAQDTVIAATTGGLAVFRVTGDRIELEQLLGIDPDAFPVGLVEPKSDGSGRHISAGAELMQRPGAVFTRTSIIECDRVARRCTLGPASPSYLPPRLVHDPSRP